LASLAEVIRTAALEFALIIPIKKLADKAGFHDLINSSKQKTTDYLPVTRLRRDLGTMP